MKMFVYQKSVLQEGTPLAVIMMYEEDLLEEPLASLIEGDDFSGKSEQTALLYPHGTLPMQRVLLVGLGKRADVSLHTIRQAAAQASRKAHTLQVTAYSLQMPIADALDAQDIAQAVVEGSRLASYRLLQYKSQPTPEERHQVERLNIFVSDQMEIQDIERGIAIGEAVTDGVFLSRDLANSPGNVVTPLRLGEVALELGETHNLNVTVLRDDDLRDFGGIRAVGQGSAEPPCFIILDYTPQSSKTDVPTICLVGKGITFDTGGISIKPAPNMGDMKMDMSGAAVVIGTMRVISELALPLRVVGLVSAAENMLGSRAYKPADIITTMSGKTVEVLNTDAEGRIVLADALHYAQRFNPDAVIDLATLTGAISIALGSFAIGVMGNNQTLIDRLIEAGTVTHERTWQLPLWDEHKELLKSPLADLKNIADGRDAGSTVAAAFLSAFVGDYPWAHLDIAGTSWNDKSPLLYETKGATGRGVRLLTHMLRHWSSMAR
jgi:leucyl aminopeptidase